MDGLDDQAQATLASIIEQLYTSPVVQVKHSSRDLIILGLTQAMKDSSSSRPIIAKKLILRSGISLQAIRWLEEALLLILEQQKEQQLPPTIIEELEFCSLQDTVILSKVFQLCQVCQITKLTLTSFLSRARGRHNMVTETIRSGLMILDPKEQVPNIAEPEQEHLGYYDILTGDATGGALDRLRISNDTPSTASNQHSCIKYLEIRNYPIGVTGTQILSTLPVATANLHTLKLLDCDLRSDSANYLAALIRHSPHLQTLDCSHNRQFRSKLTREMTIKTIVRNGMQDNLSLLQLYLNGVDNDINRTKLDRHLDINRLMLAYSQEKKNRALYGIHPAIFGELLGRVSVKPAALYFFLQQNITTIFA
eukprot:scaffold8070_cov117-Cylindrotheca_fusiformis.AAC.13